MLENSNVKEALIKSQIAETHKNKKSPSKRALKETFTQEQSKAYGDADLVDISLKNQTPMILENEHHGINRTSSGGVDPNDSIINQNVS